MFFKRTVMRITAAVLTVSTLAAPALAVAGVTNTGSSKLNLRASATSSSSVLAKIPGGSSVEVLNTDTAGWYQISFSGMTGYVASQYVDLVRNADPVRGRITDGPLNIRSTPSTSGTKCGKLYAGTEVEILETVNGWYRIDKGYVSADYVTLLTETAPQPAESSGTITPVEIVAAPTEQTPAAPAASEQYGRVIDGPLNVRSAPSTSGTKCGKLYAGKVVEILEVLDSWYRIENGYVSADYVMLVDESALSASSVADQAVELALSYVGYPYVYGGSSPKGFDCSGFTSYVYKQFGISLNRSAANQLDNGTPVAMSELLPGDLVLFKKAGTGSKRASHVGIYIGNHQFVHASTYGVGVIVNDLSDAYYTTGFVGGRRIV